MTSIIMKMHTAAETATEECFRITGIALIAEKQWTGWRWKTNDTNMNYFIIGVMTGFIIGYMWAHTHW